MSISNKIKAILNLSTSTHADLAKYLGMSPQALSNKFYRNSFSAADLIKIADFLSCDLAFVIDQNQKIILDKSDITG